MIEQSGYWTVGSELLKSGYEGDRKKFFSAIVSGDIVPFARMLNATDEGVLRLFPQHCDHLRAKLARLKQLEGFVESTDEELLLSHFVFENGCDDREEFKKFRAEQGPTLIEKFAEKRPERERELKQLRVEIGDPDASLAPSAVWRGVHLTSEIQKELLDAHYFVDIGGSNKRLAGHEGEVQENKESEKEIVDRLKKEGKTDVEIVGFLLDQYPFTRSAAIEILLHGYDEQLSESTPRKRGDKLAVDAGYIRLGRDEGYKWVRDN